MVFFEYIERHKFSILGTIAIHVAILVWMNLQLVNTISYKPKERVVIRLDFTEDENENEELSITDESNALDGNSPLTNVVANANQEKTSYTNQSFSKSKADQEVLDELKKLEAAEYNSIEHNEQPKNLNQSNNNNIDEGLVKEDAQTNENAAYGNDIKATASYYLPNRTPQYKPTPSYKCTSEGIVTLKIKVNQKGRVVSLSIDEAKTNTQNECLRNEALKYAKKWRFTQDFNDVAKKSGWIKFTYVSQ